MPGVLDPGDRGALWVTTCLNCETRSSLFSKLVIQVDARLSVEMAYPKDLTTAESAVPEAAKVTQAGRRRPGGRLPTWR